MFNCQHATDNGPTAANGAGDVTKAQRRPVKCYSLADGWLSTWYDRSSQCSNTIPGSTGAKKMSNFPGKCTEEDQKLTKPRCKQWRFHVLTGFKKCFMRKEMLSTPDLRPRGYTKRRIRCFILVQNVLQSWGQKHIIVYSYCSTTILLFLTFSRKNCVQRVFCTSLSSSTAIISMKVPHSECLTDSSRACPESLESVVA